MKRFSSILLLALCFCLAVSCGTKDLPGQTDEGPASSDSDILPAADTDTDAAGDAPQPAPEGDSADVSPEDTGDFSALSAAECVEDALPEPGVLPRITLSCPGAETINQAIQDTFLPLTEDPSLDLYYEYAKGAGHILSVVIVTQRGNDFLEYTAYDLDMTTGQALSADELLASLGVDADELAERELAVMAEEFTHQFGSRDAQADADFYDQQYERTTAPDNAELEKLWFNSDGQLCFAGRVYPLAGAEYYEYPMSTGLVF